MSILFDTQGSELGYPSYRLLGKLYDAEDPRDLVNKSLDILGSRGGYSRLIAAKALLMFFEEEKNRKYLTKRAARVLAENVIELARPLGADSAVTKSTITKGPVPLPIVERIRPRCVLRFDYETFVIVNALPEGWKAENGMVQLDGKTIAETPVYEDPERPMNFVSIESHLTPETFYGRHTLTSRLTLIAPNGIRIPMKVEETLDIVKPEAFDD